MKFCQETLKITSNIVQYEEQIAVSSIASVVKPSTSSHILHEFQEIKLNVTKYALNCVFNEIIWKKYFTGYPRLKGEISFPRIFWSVIKRLTDSTTNTASEQTDTTCGQTSTTSGETSLRVDKQKLRILWAIERVLWVSRRILQALRVTRRVLR